MVLKGHRKGVGWGQRCLRPALDFPFLLPLASGGPFWRGRQDTGQRWLQSALCPLLTSGDLGKCGFGPRKRGSAGSGLGGRARQRASKLLS